MFIMSCFALCIMVCIVSGLISLFKLMLFYANEEFLPKINSWVIFIVFMITASIICGVVYK